MHTHYLLAALVFACVGTCALAAEVTLPAPQKSGGPDVLAALDQRGSATGVGFPQGTPSDQDLATILWAATGHNRDGQRWTVPTGMGVPPYVRVYLLRADGSYYYDYTKQSLVRVSTNDNRADIALQDFVKKAPMQLVFAVDNAMLAQMPNPVFGSEFGLVLVGAMTQNVYHACTALGVGSRVIYSIDRAATARLLDFPENMVAICSMPLGK